MPESHTFMLYKGDGKKDEDNLAVVTVTTESIRLVALSQFMDLRHDKDVTFATLTWPSSVRIREVGK